MNILILTKRQYTNKDVIDDQYGRLWEIPLCLFNRGHNIKGICLSYRRRKNKNINLTNNNSLEWVSFNFIPQVIAYFSYILIQIKSFKPHIIWASSDCFHVVLGYLLGKIFKIPCVIDLYDNYEAFKLSKLTGIIPLYRLAVKNVDGISVISSPLNQLIKYSYKAKGKISIIENGVNADVFYPHDKISARYTFNLPQYAKIIGTAGALDESRGISNLYVAFDSLSKEIPGLYLVVAGPGNREHPIFKRKNIRDLGMLSNEDVAEFLNALDVAVICNKNSDFGRYCFPQKAYEILACEIPLISANVGSMAVLLKDYPECLYDPLNPQDLACKIDLQLKSSTKIKIPINTWSIQAQKLETLMKTTISNFGQ